MSGNMIADFVARHFATETSLLDFPFIVSRERVSSITSTLEQALESFKMFCVVFEFFFGLVFVVRVICVDGCVV